MGKLTEVNKLISYFFSDLQKKEQTRWFKKLLYLLVFGQVVYWLLYFKLYFGANSLVYTSQVHFEGFKNLAFLLYNREQGSADLIVLFVLGALCLFSLFSGRSFFFTDLLIWFLVLNVHNRVYPTLSGGNFLLNQYLFFGCFLMNRVPTRPGAFAALRVCAHNFALVALITQVCFAYFLSALAKLEDADWLGGSAIARVAATDHFSLFGTLRYDPALGIFYTAFNFVLLFYQLLFPIMIWVKRFEKPFLLFGLATHLYISLVMGLLLFGIVMVLGYVLLWPFKSYRS